MCLQRILCRPLVPLGFLVAATLAPAPATAAVEFTATPSALEIPKPGSDVQLLLIVRADQQPMSGLTISFFADAPVKVTPATATAASLGAGAELAFTFTVRPSEDLVAGALYARLDYRTAGIAHVQTATIRISNRSLPDAEAIVAISVAGALDTLQQNHTGTVDLIVTNKSSAPISIVSAKPSGPSFITITETKESSKLPRQIPPRQTRMLVFEVTANDRVVPGKYLVVFTTDVHVSTGGGIDVTSVASREVNVGVFGESQILQALAVPSFLLLPGFLVLIAAKMLWDRRLLRTAVESTTFPWVFPSPEFWVLAIMISGAVAFIYPLSGRPNYLEAYGPTDVAIVWVLAVGLGAAAYVLVMLPRRMWLDHLARQLLSVHDDELVTLEKLARLGTPIALQRYALTIDNVAVKAFRVDRDSGQTEVWVFPAVRLVPAQGIAEKEYERIMSAAAGQNTIRTMMETLRGDIVAKRVTLKWRAQGTFDRPRQVRWADVKATADVVAPLVVVEELAEA